MLTWMRSFGDLQRIGVECTGSYGAGLLRYMKVAGVEVLEVTAPDKLDRRRRSEDQRKGKAPIAVHRPKLTPKHFDFGHTEQRRVMAAEKVYLEMYLTRASPAKYPVYSRS